MSRKSVTEILQVVFPINLNNKIPKHILEGARRRGVTVHEWIENYNNWSIKKEGDKPVIDFEYQIYADYYEQWFEEYEVVPIHSELKLVIPEDEDNEALVGVIDMLCKTKNDEECLVSFKLTYSYNKKYCELQESAYNELLSHNGYIANKVPAYLLHLNKQGYKFVKLEDRWEIFQMIRKVAEFLGGKK